MRKPFFSDSCKEPQPLNPQPWLQVERGKLTKISTYSCNEPLIKVAEPPILPYYKPLDYVEVLAQIHEELESSGVHNRASLYLLQFQVFRGLGEVKLLRRSLRSAWQNASTVHERLIFGAWLKYEKQADELIGDLLTSCGKCTQEFGYLDIASSQLDFGTQAPQNTDNDGTSTLISNSVMFRIGDEKIEFDRQKMAAMSIPFHAMLNGCFTESKQKEIDMSENCISPMSMRAVVEFSQTNDLKDLSSEILLEILSFANKFCCEKLKDICDRKLAAMVCSRQEAIDLMEYALQENSPVSAASCLQVFLHDLPACLNDEQVTRILCEADAHQRSIMVGHASFSLFCFLSEVAMNHCPTSDVTVKLLERLAECASDVRQKQLALHQLGCIRLLRKEYGKAGKLFDAAYQAGHVYSSAGLSRVSLRQGNRVLANEKINSIISLHDAMGWMYQERSLYCDGEKRWGDLQKATDMDPTLIYPYMYRADTLMREQNMQSALTEINRVLGFKLSLECLELRFCFYLLIEDYTAALSDIQAILTLNPQYKMLDRRVPASQLHTLVREHVNPRTTADCWLQLYDRWSSVDDIGSLSVIYLMLESDPVKGVLYFRQSLLLLRLNCPEAAMRSLQLARQHAASEPERLVYEGWILYDTGHCEEGLRKAEESLKLQRSFEAFFLKAYALADSSPDPSYNVTVVSLLEDALKCPSDRLRKGQALNNLGSVYVECGKLEMAAQCYINALNIRHTRAHQGLARVHYLKNNREAAYEEMTKLIEKAKNNASAYEKRSEYCDRDLTKEDLKMVTQLDPLRVYPYRYRAAVLMDSHCLLRILNVQGYYIISLKVE